ncbi:hypothetical protein GCM10022245_05270 [Streptomyces mayteni]
MRPGSESAQPGSCAHSAELLSVWANRAGNREGSWEAMSWSLPRGRSQFVPQVFPKMRAWPFEAGKTQVRGGVAE